MDIEKSKSSTSNSSDSSDDSEKIEEEDYCLYFPARTIDTSPRSEIAIFRLTEEIINDYPHLRQVLTPLTNTNHSLIILTHKYKLCKFIVLYGESMEDKVVDEDVAISVYERYIDQIHKVYPISVERVKINYFTQTVNDMSIKDFLNWIEKKVGGLYDLKND